MRLAARTRTAAAAFSLLLLAIILLDRPATPAYGAEAAAVVQLPGSAPAAHPSAAVQNTAAATPIEFDVALKLSDPEGAVELERAVSEPGGSSYRKFLTAEQWERRFSPSEAAVKSVTAWLSSEGITVESVTPDHMTIAASAPASVVEKAFGTSLAEYSSHGHLLRLASGPLSVPANVAGLISAVSGVNQRVMKPAGLGLPGDATQKDAEASEQTSEASAAESLAVPASKPIQPPEWPLTPQPCSGYWDEKQDTVDPRFGAGYPSPMPYGDCGYVPAQLQGAYDLSQPIAAGDNGAGETVAITDAYASPTLYSDAHEWSKHNAPGQLLRNSQFKEDVASKFNEEKLCGASGWSIEQTLDVESVHSTAPGATILYMGAKNCGQALYGAIQTVVDEHLASVVTDSWGEYGNQELTPPAEDLAFDNVLLMAAGTGVGVQFSAGDEGDQFSVSGFNAPEYPAESPYATGVGGTAIEINKSDQRSEELGWSNSISALCSAVVEEHEEAVELLTEQPIECTGKLFGKWLPSAPGGYWAGGGGGTSYHYAEPYYQEGVVPAGLANRNKTLTHTANRVVPDISMDADPFTGLKMGETIDVAGEGKYEEFPIGGTSLASPLLAGELADADQAAGGPLGFINPLIYRLEASPSTAGDAFYDILAPRQKQANAIENYVNETGPEEGLYTTVRTLGYEGKEVFCEEGNCTSQKIILSAGKGYDSMTGIGSPGPEFVKELSAP
jgi:subtilase family serine protease